MFAGHLLYWSVFNYLWLWSCDVTQNTGLEYHLLTIHCSKHLQSVTGFPSHWQNLTTLLLKASTSSLQKLLHTVLSSKTYYVCQSNRSWTICKGWASPDMCWLAHCPCIQYWLRNIQRYYVQKIMFVTKLQVTISTLQLWINITPPLDLAINKVINVRQWETDMWYTGMIQFH
jgi:hypothetical protein